MEDVREERVGLNEQTQKGRSETDLHTLLFFCFNRVVQHASLHDA